MDFNKDPDFMKKRMEYMKHKKDESGSGRDFIFKDKPGLFQPREGSNTVRIMEPTWEDAMHYGLDVWAHYSIGPSKSTFLCLEKMEQGKCPICDEQRKALRANDQEYAKTLGAQHRVMCYCIDRMAEESGPLVWNMPYARVAKVLLVLAYDKRGDGFLLIDDPKNGYDISFDKKGKGLATQYEALKIEPRSVPLADNAAQMEKWLSQVRSKPLPALLNYHSYEYVRTSLLGEQETPPEVDEKPIMTKAGAAAYEELKPTPPATPAAPKVQLVPDQPAATAQANGINIGAIKNMNRKELVQVIEQRGLEVDAEDFDTKEELASMILLELGLTE